jgi:hypothetical protein
LFSRWQTIARGAVELWRARAAREETSTVRK